MARGSAAALAMFWAIRCSATQPVSPSPSAQPELVGRLVDVLADLAEHRHRDEVRADDPIDPGVVVVDQLAQLARDRLADLVDGRQPAEPGTELLDRLELGRPGRHPLEVLRGTDGDARLGRERADGGQLVLGPVVRLIVIDVEHAREGPSRRAAVPCTACRTLPGRRPRGRLRRAGHRGSGWRTAAGGPRWRRSTGSELGSHGSGRCRRTTGHG